MIVTCEKCQRRYTLQEDKIRSDARKVRCRNCKNLITLPPRKSTKGHGAVPTAEASSKGQGTVSTAEASSKGQRVVSTPEASHWYAMVQGAQLGPMDDGTLAAKAGSGEITSETFVWRRGMGAWKQAADVAEASSLLSVGGPMVSAPASPTAQTSSQPPNARTTPSQLLAAAHSTQVQRTSAEESNEASEGLVEGDHSKFPPPEEETSVFLDQSGIGRRNSRWKIASFLAALVALPLLLVFMFSGPRLVPVQVSRVDDSGHEVKESVFKTDGVSGLGDLLLGRRKSQRSSPAGNRPGVAEPPLLQRAGPPGRGAVATKPDEATPGTKPVESSEPVQPTAGGLPELNALYADGTHTDVGPRVRKGEDEKSKDTTVGGLGQRDVAKVVSRAQPAFQFCIEQELRKNPKFRGGKIFITATIGGSGIVKSAEVDRKEIDASPLGECLRGKARRMVFPAFSGDDTEIQIPLILGATM